MTTKYLEKEDVCNRYRISINTLYEWTSSKHIPFLKPRGKLLFREQDLDRWDEKNLIGVSNTKLI